MPAMSQSLFAPTRKYHMLQKNFSRHLSLLTGKKCVITGASSGIGRAIAEHFVRNGAICYLVGRNRQRLEEVAQSSESGVINHADRIHVGKVEDRSFWQALSRQINDIDVVINAAGIAQDALLVATKPESIESIVQTNLMGTVWSCQIMAKQMMRRKQGCIINVSSLLGQRGGRGSTIYAASKAGIIALTRSLAIEMGSSGIRFNVIVPGYIDTPMTQAMTLEAKQQALQAIPSNRFGTTQEVADAALFLACNDYANNCVLNLDGGLSAQ